MRLITIDGRLAIESDGLGIDVERASAGRFGPDPQSALDEWAAFTAWAADADLSQGQAFEPGQLGAPVGVPRQIFAIGLNYRAHAAETGIDLPEVPVVFTKFASSITGPFSPVAMPAGDVDWEAELVAVIGVRAEGVAEAEAWSHVAGLTIGQDLSERRLQVHPPAPQQFSLAKSFPGFAPLGPALVTPDEFDDPDDLEISCHVNAEEVQQATTSDLIFSVPRLVAYLSSILPLLPGDLIFTGTPSGIGFARTPQRYLEHSDLLRTSITGIGEMRNEMLRAAS